MANKRIKDLTEKSSFVSGDYFPIDNSNGTKKVNASKIMTPLSSAQTDATRALTMARNTSSFPTGDAYSSSSSYKVGDMVIYNNTLYRCKTACSAASWAVNANNFEAISLASALTDVNNDLTWKLLVSHAMNDVWTPTRDLPSEFREMMFVYHYGGITCSTILNKQSFALADSVKSYYTGWYATPTNCGTFTITYSNSKFSLYDFYYQSASHHDATCEVYYR